MHALCAVIFWFCVLFVIYTYALYPLLIALWARMFPCPVQRRNGFTPSVSIVLAAYQEALNLPGRVANLLEQDYPPEKMEIILVDDGSADGSAQVMAELARQQVPVIKVIALKENQGKAVALNCALEQASGDIIVFADARQRFEPDAVARLAENFADPQVGAVSGELMFTTDKPKSAAARQTAETVRATNGIAEQVGLYWKYEKWMRRSEAEIDSMLGATGAIYAIRRVLFRTLPAGTLLDDFLTPMRIVLGGHRAIFDGRARAWDVASTRGGQEFLRKARTLAGNYQAFALEPGILRPWVNQTTWLQVWSHKLFRLWVPFALVLMVFSCLYLAIETVTSPVYHNPVWFLIALAQCIFYAAAAHGWRLEKKGLRPPNKFVSLSYTFTVLNLAAVWGLRMWLERRDQRDTWKKAYAHTREK